MNGGGENTGATGGIIASRDGRRASAVCRERAFPTARQNGM